MNRLSLIVCAAVGLVALTTSNVRAQPSTIEGVYTFDTTASDDINAAINTATAKMNFLIKGIAKSRLKKTNPAYQRISIARAPGEIVVTLDDRKPIRMPDNGKSIKWTREDGEKFDLTANWKDTQLVQTYVAEDGRRVNDFGLGADGNAMTLHVTITSERLDKPMTYKLAYKRAAS